MYIYIYMYIYSIYLAYNQLDTDNPSKVMRGRAGDLLLLLYLANAPSPRTIWNLSARRELCDCLQRLHDFLAFGAAEGSGGRTVQPPECLRFN